MTSVPRYSVLKPSIRVNIVLKADQPTGRLTTGIIADILTSGDHPRGVKVRLQSGAIGRVQSLATSGAAVHHNNGQDETISSREQGYTTPRSYRFQDDFRKTEPPPNQPASLSDYIKAPSRNKKKKKSSASTTAHENMDSNKNKGEEMSDQARLESMFPKLDSALVAAILGDSGNITEATEILKSLS